ncbi:hypothetical protein TMM008_34160 [Pseudomonas sp. 008]|nr:hypothetical protein TMM008_34160 [Pseudomonas sp. 008]
MVYGITRGARSSCRAREAAFGGAAVVKSDNAVIQANRIHRTCEDFVLERSLAGSAAATALRSAGYSIPT